LNGDPLVVSLLLLLVKAMIFLKKIAIIAATLVLIPVVCVLVIFSRKNRKKTVAILRKGIGFVAMGIFMIIALPFVIIFCKYVDIISADSEDDGDSSIIGPRTEKELRSVVSSPTFNHWR